MQEGAYLRLASDESSQTGQYTRATASNDAGSDMNKDSVVTDLDDDSDSGSDDSNKDDDDADEEGTDIGGTTKKAPAPAKLRVASFYRCSDGRVMRIAARRLRVGAYDVSVWVESGFDLAGITGCRKLRCVVESGVMSLTEAASAQPALVCQVLLDGEYVYIINPLYERFPPLHTQQYC